MDDSEVDLIFRKNLNKKYLFFVEKYCRKKIGLFFRLYQLQAIQL